MSHGVNRGSSCVRMDFVRIFHESSVMGCAKFVAYFLVVFLEDVSVVFGS